MGTRCGSIDPGVILYLMDQRGMDARAVENSSTSSRGCSASRGLERHAHAAQERRAAREAGGGPLRLPHRARARLAAAALGGVDALVFTGGIGENAAEIRARVCRDAVWLGLELDAGNDRGGPRISAAGSRVAAWVIREELVIATQTRSLVAREIA